MMSMHAGIHGLENVGMAPITRTGCMPRYEARLTKYLLTLGHNRTHQRHLDVSGFEVHGLGEVRRGRSGGSGPGAAVSATDATCNAASVFAGLTGIHVAEVRLRRQGRRRDRNSSGVG